MLSVTSHSRPSHILLNIYFQKWLWKSKNHVLVNSWKSWICLENNKIKAGRSYILWTNLFLFFMLASFTEFHFRVIVHTQYSKPSWKFWTSDKGLGEKNGDESKTSEVFRLVETTGSREEKKKKNFAYLGSLVKRKSKSRK